jgi:hypothetical protein
MANNGKNNAQGNGNSRKSGRVLTHRLVISTPQKKQSPAAERRRAHTSKTRISAIAHRSAERTLKSAPVIPEGYQRRLQYSLIRGKPEFGGEVKHASGALISPSGIAR